MKLTHHEKREIISWLMTKYDDKLTMLDYCYSIYYEILDHCCKHDMILMSSNEIFFAHLISILYKTYTLR